jgi:hypothetical protein
MNARGSNTKGRPFTNRGEKHGGFESTLPWVLTFAALALFILAAVARGDDTRTLTHDPTAFQKLKPVMKAGCPVDRHSL